MADLREVIVEVRGEIAVRLHELADQWTDPDPTKRYGPMDEAEAYADDLRAFASKLEKHDA